MRNLVEILIERKRALFLVLAMLYIWGIKSYVNIPKEDNPSVQIPFVFVNVVQNNISPEDAERLLIRPLETALKSIDNIKNIESRSHFGGGYIILKFKTDVQIKDAVSDVRDKINKVKSQLPKDALDPETSEINLSEGDVISIAIYGDAAQKSLVYLARELSDKIKEIPSVLDAKIIGDRIEQGQIIINPKEILLRELDLGAVVGAIRSSNELQPLGKYSSQSGRHGMVLNSVIADLADLKKLPVANYDNYVLRLGDIADIQLAFDESTQLARVNGRGVVAINVQKKSGANIIKVIDEVKQVVSKESINWPANIAHIYSNDNSDEIKESISGLENALILTVILSIIPIYLTIGLRSALLVAFAIPTSFLFGVLTIDLLGYTMNVVVIFSLILSVGMLVDASIVVCEFADSRMSEGKDAITAYKEAASKMWWPVFSSTLTTLIVYFPLFVWPGIIGKFMYFLPLTLLATVTGSLIVAYSFVPALGTTIPRKLLAEKQPTFNQFEQKIVDKYEAHLHKVLNKPGRFAISIFASLIVVIFIFGIFGAGFEFFPNAEPKILNVSLKSKDPLSLQQIEEVVTEVEDKIKQNFSKEVKIIYSNYFTENAGQSLKIAEISLQLSHWKSRRQAGKIVSDIREKLSDIYGVEVTVIEQKDGPPGASPIMLNISSSEPDLLEGAYKKIKAIMKDSKNLIDIQSDNDEKQFEWEIKIDKEKAARYGVNAQAIGSFLQMSVAGMKVTSYRPSNLNREVDVLVKFPIDYRSFEQIKNLRIVGNNGAVSISNFVEFIPIYKVKSLMRINGQRAITINANILPGAVLNNEVVLLSKQIRELNLDPRINIKCAGETEDMEETGQFLSNAFMLALLSMFLVMLIQFNSFYETIVIMTAVFLSTTGVMLGLLITARPFGVVMCGLGIIALAGVVVNNNIIFIDCYKDYLKQGMNIHEAIIKTGRDRIRPILLTAITAVLGLLPMVIGFDIDFLALELNIDPPSNKWWAQLSTTICGGLAFATLLTLFFTPALLMLEGRVKIKIRKIIGCVYDKATRR